MHEVCHKEVPPSPHKVWLIPKSMVPPGHDEEVEIFVRLDQCIYQLDRCWKRHIIIQISVRNEQFAF